MGAAYMGRYHKHQERCCNCAKNILHATFTFFVFPDQTQKCPPNRWYSTMASAIAGIRTPIADNNIVVFILVYRCVEDSESSLIPPTKPPALLDDACFRIDTSICIAMAKEPLFLNHAGSRVTASLCIPPAEEAFLPYCASMWINSPSSVLLTEEAFLLYTPCFRIDSVRAIIIDSKPLL